MAIILQPATVEDVYEIAACNFEAYRTDPIQVAIWGSFADATTQHCHEEIERRAQRLTAPIQRSDLHYIKAVDEANGSIIGFSCWAEPKDRSQHEDTEPSAGNATALPVRANSEVFERVQSKLAELEKEVVGDRTDLWYLRGLAVTPSHQHHGVGQRLVGYGIQTVADHGKEDIYVLSSDVARKLYSRNGFEALKQIELAEGRSTTAMLRKAKVQS